MSKHEPTKPVSLRLALITLLAAITAVAGGSLLYAGLHSIALAILSGGAAFAGAWRFYDEIIA